MAPRLPRNTTLRNRHRRIIAADRPPCGICGEHIDYELPYLHPKSFVVDHITPCVLGGPDVLENKQAAHRDCNRAKGATLGYQPGVTFATDRTW